MEPVRWPGSDRALALYLVGVVVLLVGYAIVAWTPHVEVGLLVMVVGFALIGIGTGLTVWRAIAAM